MSATAWTLAYLYLAGVANGLLLVALEEERIGKTAPAFKAVFATVFWPLLIPALAFRVYVAPKVFGK